MSGIEACKLIRTMGFRGPIVAVTGNIVPEDVEEFLAAGADKLVGKPMKLETLVTTLDGEFSQWHAIVIKRVQQSLNIQVVILHGVFSIVSQQ